MWRTRVIGLEFHKAGDLLDHPLQWKIHPEYQRAVVRGILEQIGIADVLLAYRDAAVAGLLDELRHESEQTSLAEYEGSTTGGRGKDRGSMIKAVIWTRDVGSFERGSWRPASATGRMR